MLPSTHGGEKIAAQLSTEIFGKNTIYFKQITSTNDYLKKILTDDTPEGTLILAEEQTAGRGRFDRRWIAPPRSSLLTSLLFRPDFLPPNRAQLLTMVCALAVTDAIAEQTGITAGLKWPNDVIFGGKKLAGILTELGIVGERLDWVIVGMGLNVNIDFSAAEPALAETATSLQTIAGRAVPRGGLLPAYLLAVEKRYNALRRGESPLAEWRSRLETLGQSVQVNTPQGVVSGVAEDVSDSGALLLRRDDGRIEEILAGDVGGSL